MGGGSSSQGPSCTGTPSSCGMCGTGHPRSRWSRPRPYFVHRDFRQIRHGPIGFVLQKVPPRCRCPWPGQRFGLDGPRATNVQRGIADDQDFIPAQRPAKTFPAPLPRDDGNLVAFLIVVGKGANGNFSHQIIMLQLDARALANVAGQQAERRAGPVRVPRRGKIPAHAMAPAALAFADDLLQPDQIRFEKRSRNFEAIPRFYRWVKNSRASEKHPSCPQTSVVPCHHAAPNSLAKARPNAFTPTPPEWRRVPSTSNNTNRIMAANATRQRVKMRCSGKKKSSEQCSKCFPIFPRRYINSTEIAVKNIVYFDLETQKSADEVGGWGKSAKCA